MNVIDVLERARAIIADPKDWCRGDFHRDGARCAMGAIMVAAPMTRVRGDKLFLGAMIALQDTVCAMSKCRNIATFNDSHTHSDVLAAFDRAIAVERLKTTAVEIAEPVDLRDFDAAAEKLAAFARADS